MSTINMENYPGFIRDNRTAVLKTSHLQTHGISSTTVFGYLMALSSAALLLLTNQPPWVLLPAAAGLVMALLLSKVSKDVLQD